MQKSSRLLRREACPECVLNGRDRSGDNLAVYDDGHSYCYSCQTYISGKKDFDLNTFTYEYLPIRSISKEIMAKYDIKAKIDEEGKPVALGFRWPNGSMQVKLLEAKEFYWIKDTAPDPIPDLFGSDKFSAGSHKYVTITEGALDAASLNLVLGSPVVSVQSASSASRDCIARRAYLNSFDRIYLAFDGDAAGARATADVARLFDYNKVFVLKFDKHKDPNDYLRAGEEAELRNIWWNAKKYLPDTVLSTFQEFEKVLNEPVQFGIPYPFTALNTMTYGIRRGESVLITAQEGVGKTEIMHAIEYGLLKQTEEAIGAIFLEEPKRRHLQAIAGLQLGRPVHLPDVAVAEGEIFSALQKAVGLDERLHVYSHFGSDDPESLLDTIRFLVSARHCHYVLFDHISMAVSGLAGDDERRALDYLATRLEMMVKELNFALIFVSHVNDQGQTRGSRYISKICDIRIDATRDVTSSDPLVRNTTNLMVSKNRFSGRTGPACSLIFDPKTYSFTQKAANDNWEFATVSQDVRAA